MWGEAAGKIEDIHAMMATGHRSIKIERHTLMLWGITGALLILIVNRLFTPEYFTVHWQQVLFSNLFVACALVLVAILDFYLTHRKREDRDETLSFVQLQLIKLWWLFIVLIVLINIGMNFYGGGYLFYPIVLALLGMALYAQGLFSQQMLSWIGACLILLGLGSIVLGITQLQQEWLTMSALGIGFTLLAWWINFPACCSGEIKRALLSVAWLLIVILPVATASWLNQDKSLDDLPVIPLDTYRELNINKNERQIVRIPAGTTLPLYIEITGNLLQQASSGSLQLMLAQDIDVVVAGEKTEGLVRVASGNWNNNRNPYRIRKFELSSSLNRHNGPEAKLLLDIEVEK